MAVGYVRLPELSRKRCRDRFLRMIEKLLIAVLLALPVSVTVSEEIQLEFDWAFVKSAPDGSVRAVDFSGKAAISPGDLFKISVRPVKNAFIYLLLHDAEGSLKLLFPGQFSDFDNSTYLNTQTFIPAGESWFTLDNASGTERFYLLASSKRLSRMESLILAYQKAAQAKGSEGKARQAVLDEIGRLRATHSQLTAAAEKPVTIAGAMRGGNSAVSALGTRIEASDFYIKTFRLQH